MHKKIICAVVAAFILCSCGSSKEIAYFQDLEAGSVAINTEHTIIRPGDILVITVTSSKPELAVPYNLLSVRTSLTNSGTSTAGLSGNSTNTTRELEGYLVDDNGNIEFPMLGSINVTGKTKKELAVMFVEILSDFMPDPVVTISIANYKITVLGEVTKPGNYSITHDRPTLLDALGMAGDMTVYGNRTNILIIRESDGQRESARLDIKSKDVLKSPYFYLQQNDVIVVEPISAKARSRSQFVQNTPLFVSLSSLLLSILTIFILK